MNKYTTRRQSRRPKTISPARLLGAMIFVAIAGAATLVGRCGDNGNQPSLNTGNAAALLNVDTPDGLPQTVKNYEGFTVNFNPAMHQPNYVAWELTASEAAGTLPRRSNFAPDPEVAGCATLDDYRGSGYDRGHLAPAADMKWSRTAMDQSHLLTNISPQNHTLNAGRWNTLEQNCRSWAARDSAIVIVAGPVLSDRMRRHIGASAIPVPERFFKVILAPYAKPPRAIGFVMPNDDSRLPLESMVYTVDQIEEITGFDFFPSLPDEIENQVEAHANLRQWTTR